MSYYKSDSMLRELTPADKDENATKEERQIAAEKAGPITYEKFRKVLEKRYLGQLLLYKATAEQLLGVDEERISFRLYSMYETEML
ncbi:MAG: hypothetical protein IJM27_00900 [Eubacterium sp.]|nr:hypothetical protein [Eubacterium sp.]